MTEFPTEHRPAPASPDPVTTAGEVADPGRPRGWRRAVTSVLADAVGGSTAGVPF